VSWTLLLGLVVVLGIALFTALSRRSELRRMQRTVGDRERMVREGHAEAQLQYPSIDLSRCLGCATCVAVCPEEKVLDVVHGQAVVINGSLCKGISACERECPVGAITVTLGRLEQRRDIPAVTAALEAVGSPGLFLAGEVTAHALIKTAVDHGTAVASEVARRVERDGQGGVLDLVVVGAGPAGLACSLEAKRRGLRFATLDQAPEPGGTVAKYPRRKLVLTQPMDMPLVGLLKRTTYLKEELVDLWQDIVREHELPIRCDETFVGLDRDEQGNHVVRTEDSSYVARHVCLALGRRGTPRTLGVPGEDLPKVAYSLLDASSYRGRRVLVVGGGDSAVEAVLALAQQLETQVTLAYRKESFVRVRARNLERLERYRAEGRIDVLTHAELTAIRPRSVELSVGEAGEGRGRERVTLPNDDVFVMAGGVLPLQLLEHAGVSFDPALRETTPEVGEQGTGFVRALAVGLVLTLAALAWALWHGDYYLLPAAERPAHIKHELLRSGRGFGLQIGIVSMLLIGVNLLYLLRRAPGFPLRFGALQTWMTSHVATGVLALLCAMLHAAMAPRETVGGHAFQALAVLLVTGAIGRYFYAYVPRATNGRELQLSEVKAALGRVSEEWGQGQRRFRERARVRVAELIEARQWKGSFVRRALALCGVEFGLRRVLKELAREGLKEGVHPDQVEETMALARRAHRTALMVAHYEDLRALLNTWRYVHRWVAALMVLLIVVHVAYALSYGELFDGLRRGGG